MEQVWGKHRIEWIVFGQEQIRFSDGMEISFENYFKGSRS